MWLHTLFGFFNLSIILYSLWPHHWSPLVPSSIHNGLVNPQWCHTVEEDYQPLLTNHTRDFPVFETEMWWLASGYGHINRRRTVLWIGTRPIGFYRASFSVMWLIMIRRSVLWWNMLPLVSFYHWSYSILGQFISWTSRISFSMGLLLKPSIAVSLSALLTLLP